MISWIDRGSRRCTRRPSGKPRPLGWKTSVWSFGWRQVPRRAGARRGTRPAEHRCDGPREREHDRRRGHERRLRARVGRAPAPPAGREPVDPHRRRQPLPRARRARDERRAGEVLAASATTPIGTTGSRARSVTCGAVPSGCRTETTLTGLEKRTVTGRPRRVDHRRASTNAAGVRVTASTVSVRPRSQPSQRDRCTVAVTRSCVPGRELHLGRITPAENDTGTPRPTRVAHADRLDVLAEPGHRDAPEAGAAGGDLRRRPRQPHGEQRGVRQAEEAAEHHEHDQDPVSVPLTLSTPQMPQLMTFSFPRRREGTARARPRDPAGAREVRERPAARHAVDAHVRAGVGRVDELAAPDVQPDVAERRRRRRGRPAAGRCTRPACRS